MQLNGLNEVTDALKELDAKMQAGILRSVAKKALKEKALGPIQGASISKRASKDIVIVNEKGSKTSVLIGPSRKYFWELWLQKGTVDRKTKKGWNRGSIKPNFKLDSAVDSTVQPIVDYYNESLGNEVKKILERKLRNTKNKIKKLR